MTQRITVFLQKGVKALSEHDRTFRFQMTMQEVIKSSLQTAFEEKLHK